MRRHAKTVFFITHSVDEAVFLGDRVLVMTRRPGEIKARIDIPRRGPGGRDWESFTADTEMKAIAEQVLHLVRAERGAAAPAMPAEVSPAWGAGVTPRRRQPHAIALVAAASDGLLGALGGLKILLPFIVLVLIWWASRSAPTCRTRSWSRRSRCGTRSCTSRPTGCWPNMPAPACA